jgi:hypothetical protein
MNFSIDSQCKDISTGVMWSLLLVRVMDCHVLYFLQFSTVSVIDAKQTSIGISGDVTSARSKVLHASSVMHDRIHPTLRSC